MIKNRPYNSIEDIFEKLPKKVFNKRVSLALAKSGALDSFEENKNRYSIINKIMELRKEKDAEEFNIRAFNKEACIEFEMETLASAITYKLWWNTIKPKDKVFANARIVTYREQLDKNGGLMAFATLEIEGCVVESVIFAFTYKKVLGLFDPNVNIDRKIVVSGVKDDKGKLIVKNVEKSIL